MLVRLCLVAAFAVLLAAVLSMAMDPALGSRAAGRSVPCGMRTGQPCHALPWSDSFFAKTPGAVDR